MSDEQTLGDVGQMRQNAATVMSLRRAIAMANGMSFDGKRDLYKACGYPQDIPHAVQVNRYERGDIAKAVVEAFPDACWQVDPTVWDTDKATVASPFEKAWKELLDSTALLSELKQQDILAGIGRYAVLYIGYDDTTDLTKPPRKGAKVLYFTAYREGNAQIQSFDSDVSSIRYGLPQTYQLTTEAGFGAVSTSSSLSSVHYSRCVHVVENRIDSKVYGRSRLEAVWNRLQDIDTVLGGGAEGFWRGGFPGTFFSMDKDARITADGKKDFDEQIENYMNSFSRTIRGQGITPHPLSSQVTSPRGQLECELWMVSATTRIPYRILTGSEQGELASSKDQDNWNTRVGSRRVRTCIPLFLRPLVQRLIDQGALPEPKDKKFEIEWASGREEKESEVIANKSSKVKMIADYLSGGVEQMIPRENFMVDYLGMDEDEAVAMLEEADKVAEEQAAQAAEDQEAAMAAQAEANAAAAKAAGGTPPVAKPGATPPEAKQPGAKQPVKAPATGLRALWDKARAAMGLSTEPVGLQFGDRVEAMMPDGMKVNGKIIGADDDGHAILFTDDRRVVALPEMLEGKE